MKFKKVSFKQFLNDWPGEQSVDKKEVEAVYDSILIPKRSTKNSAGYDFITPFELNINPGGTVKVPSGIRCVDMPGNLFLAMYVRSSVGIKKDVVISNGTGIIDSDYADAENEGHIWIALRNDGQKPQHFDAGERIAQGVFQVYFMTDDDVADAKRTGGIGSTNNN